MLALLRRFWIACHSQAELSGKHRVILDARQVTTACHVPEVDMTRRRSFSPKDDPVGPSFSA